MLFSTSVFVKQYMSEQAGLTGVMFLPECYILHSIQIKCNIKDYLKREEKQGNNVYVIQPN